MGRVLRGSLADLAFAVGHLVGDHRMPGGAGFFRVGPTRWSCFAASRRFAGTRIWRFGSNRAPDLAAIACGTRVVGTARTAGRRRSERCGCVGQGPRGSWSPEMMRLAGRWTPPLSWARPADGPGAGVVRARVGRPSPAAAALWAETEKYGRRLFRCSGRQQPCGMPRTAMQ